MRIKGFVIKGFPGGAFGRDLPVHRRYETGAQFLGWEDLWRRTYGLILAGEFHGWGRGKDHWKLVVKELTEPEYFVCHPLGC